MDTEKIANEVNEINLRLEALREQHGKVVKVAVGDRGVMRHHASLDLPEHAVENAKSIFPEVTDEEFFWDDETRHHPFMGMLGMIGQCAMQELRLLPGESYDIYQDDDDEVAVKVVRAGMPAYTLTADQVLQFMELYDVTDKHPCYGDFVSLMKSL